MTPAPSSLDARAFDEAVLAELAAMLAAVPIVDGPAELPSPPSSGSASREPETGGAPSLLELLNAIQQDLEPLRTPAAARGPENDRSRRSPGEDEWGLFDPRHCGIAALLARLEQIAEQRENGRPQR